MCPDMHVSVCVDVRVDMRVGTYVDMRVDRCADMCIDMYIGIGIRIGGLYRPSRAVGEQDEGSCVNMQTDAFGTVPFTRQNEYQPRLHVR